MRQRAKAYTPYWIFAGIGIVLVLLSWIFHLQDHTFWFQLFFALGASMFALTVIEFIWKYHGGDPVSKAIAALRTSTSLLKDLEETGLQRIHLKRANVNFSDWLEFIGSARKVDMMGINLRTRWTARREFLDIVEDRAKQHKTAFRFLVLAPDPASSITVLRVKEEEDQFGRIIANTKESLRNLNEVRNALDDKTKNEYTKIRVMKNSTMYCSIIRANDRMLVTQYTSHLRGSDAPTVEIRGEGTSFFRVFADEFERM